MRKQPCWQLGVMFPSEYKQKQCLNRATPWPYLEWDSDKATVQPQKWFNTPLFCLTGETAAPVPYRGMHAPIPQPASYLMDKHYPVSYTITELLLFPQTLAPQLASTTQTHLESSTHSHPTSLSQLQFCYSKKNKPNFFSQQQVCSWWSFVGGL